MDAFDQAEDGAVYVVEKHAPLYLRGQKERTYISRQGNLGTVFAKIIRRAGIVPWQKLIHNLRASFETDLLNGKFDIPNRRIGIQTVAMWLGHSVKIMLEHYGRTQKSDYDQIEQVCSQVKQKKDQTMRNEEAHFVPFPTQNDEFTVKSATSIAGSGILTTIAFGDTMAPLVEKRYSTVNGSCNFGFAFLSEHDWESSPHVFWYVSSCCYGRGITILPTFLPGTAGFSAWVPFFSCFGWRGLTLKRFPGGTGCWYSVS